jgi:DNA topoisomerase I
MGEWIERRGTRESGFRYTASDGRRVSERAVLERIERLRIPPAWRDVHIARSARAAIQAWGFDARGRKQYRYHATAVEKGALRKYHRVRQLGRDLPTIRRIVQQDFQRRGLARRRVAAAVVRLLGEAFFRVGSDRYAKDNRTFGVTTLRKSHVKVRGDRITFTYTGKGSIEQRQTVIDRELARFVRLLLASPGDRLFRYRDAGGWSDLTSRDVNAYIRGLAKIAYTAKDFRTWGGTLRVATVLSDLGPARTPTEAKRNVVTAVRLTAAELGNTPAVCRASYVHPMVIARYLDEGVTIESAAPGRVSRAQRIGHAPEERALLRFLDLYFPERRRRRRIERRAA